MKRKALSNVGYFDMKYIEKMNEMFKANPYTDNGRVAVDYAPNCDVIVINVCGKTAVIEIEGLTDIGVMWAVLDKVKEMY